MKSKKGRDEYQRRKRVMWDRQRGICCLVGTSPMCPGMRPGRNGRVAFAETQFDHEHGRGGGKQDDRVEVERDGKLVPQNGACCAWCNTAKGSRKIPYNYMDIP